MVEFHPEARAELFEAADHYDKLSPGLGRAMLVAIRAAAALAQQAPEGGAPVGADLRRVFVRRFPYYLLYSASPERIYILAVAHFRRHPKFWAGRE